MVKVISFVNVRPTGGPIWVRFGFLRQFLSELQRGNTAQRAMGAYVVVLPSPVFDCHSSLGQSPKLLAVEALLSETRVEALHVSPAAAGPGASRLFVERLDPILGKPAAQPALDELRTVVAADMFGSSVPLDQRGHDPPCLASVDPPIHVDV